MIDAMRESGVEVGLEGECACSDVPRSIFELGIQQELHAFLECRMRYWDSSSLESKQSPSGLIRIGYP